MSEHTTSIADSQHSNPHFSNWTAMGLLCIPFNWRRTPEPPKQITAAERERNYQREYAKTRYVKVADRAKSITEFKSTHLNLAGSLTEPPAAKAKTARLIGRPNGARTQ